MEFLSSGRFRELMSEIDTFVFDCDGVIWRGGQILPGVRHLTDMLYRAGKKVIFLSNNSTRSRAQLHQTLVDIGIPSCKYEDAYNTAWGTAMYIRDVLRIPMGSSILVFGEEGLNHELQSIGYKPFNPPTLPLSELSVLSASPEVQAVVVGLYRGATFNKLAYTCIHAQNPRAAFIAANTDPVFPTQKALFPGSGSLVAAVATGSKRQPIIIGKPLPTILPLIYSQLGIPDNATTRSRTLVIGDSVHTDIPFARVCKTRSLLVLTGVTSTRELDVLREKFEQHRPAPTDSYDLNDQNLISKLSLVGGLPQLQCPDFVIPSLDLLFAKL
ncbi:2-phosphoglycolate phosphatase [Pelomyxa schiedti]|nr:2-phosphoglycolate phosphatase [Pelomyxa schiedti]